MGKNNYLSKLGIIALITIVLLAMLYVGNVMPYIIASSTLSILTVAALAIIFLLLFSMIRIRLPAILSLFLIAALFIFLFFTGSDFYTKSLLQKKSTTLASSLSAQDYDFIEMFYAMEIEGSLDGINTKAESLENASYIDYIIYKYNMWTKGKLDYYKQMKENLSLDNDKWKDLLLRAQDYRKQIGWREDLDAIADNRQNLYIESIKTTNPKLYEILNNFDKIIDNTTDQMDEDKAKEFYNAVFPSRPFPSTGWEESINRLKEDIKQDRQIWTKEIIHSHIREAFKEEYQKTLL